MPKRSTFASLANNFKRSLDVLESARKAHSQINRHHDSTAYIARVKRNLTLARNNARNSKTRLLARTKSLGRNL